jgi:hypothetical protein
MSKTSRTKKKECEVNCYGSYYHIGFLDSPITLQKIFSGHEVLKISPTYLVITEVEGTTTGLL